MRCNIRIAYLFLYNLLQFCGHTWIFTNMTARFLSFGTDALADTFYTVGVATSLCQLFAVLELFHLADGIEKGTLLPRFVQITQRIFLLFVVIATQDEVQSKPVVCVLFYLWNILGLLRYTYGMLSVMNSLSFDMIWSYYTLHISVYPLSVLLEGVTVWQALPYFESTRTYSFQMAQPVSLYVHFPYVLLGYLPLLLVGACFIEWKLIKERRYHLENWNKKLKRK